MMYRPPDRTISFELDKKSSDGDWGLVYVDLTIYERVQVNNDLDVFHLSKRICSVESI